MNARHTGARLPICDRQLLLSDPERNAVLELWEVESYGIDSYDDADYVLDKANGLDLRRTAPPILEIVDFLFNAFTQNRLLCAVQVYEAVTVAPLAELESRFDWSSLHVHSLNVPGENHGILLGSKRWTP